MYKGQRQPVRLLVMRPNCLGTILNPMGSVFAEFERIIGTTHSPYNFEFVAADTDPDQLLELLRSAPSEIGVSGLETYLRDRLGAPPGHVRIDDVE